MEQILDSPVDVEKKLKYAGFWIRVASYLIDGVILWIVNVLFNLAILGSITAVSPENIGLAFIPMALSFVLNIIYFAAFESSGKQATLGKMAVGIKVGGQNGEQISFGNALGRYFAKILSALILCVGFMMAGWDDRKQGLHDKLANTFVYYA